MPASNFSDVFNNGVDILSSSIASNGTILLQTGSALLEDVISDGAELWQPSGYIARPAKATPGKEGAQGLSITARDQDIVFATRDIRANPLVEELGYGEVQLFAGGPENSGISKIVLNNDGNGNQRVTVTANTTIVEINSDGTVTITADTVNVNAGTVNLGNGASDSVALAPVLQSWAAQLVTFVTAVNTAIPTSSSAPGSPPTLSGSVASSAVKAAG